MLTYNITPLLSRIQIKTQPRDLNKVSSMLKKVKNSVRTGGSRNQMFAQVGTHEHIKKDARVSPQQSHLVVPKGRRDKGRRPSQANANKHPC
jgi:hypothetical protein